MAELGVGWISILPETSKISPGIAKALKASEGAADSTGDSMGSKISSKLGGALKKGAIGAGVSAGGVLAASITKGLGRLNSIEQAEAKLKGLGSSTQQVGSIMENALASVNGTAFGLEEAATTAGSLVAAGIKPGQELEGVLTTVADTATIAGRSMSDMGLIFGSVAAKGKLQGDDMLQLLAGGIPVLQLLADETGKTSAEISDMVSNGEVDFALFERAMKRGMGGAALEAGNTVQGAFKNMGAAAGRLGATIAGPFFTQAAGGFTGVTKALDDLNGRMKPVMEDMASWLTGTAVPALKDFGQQGAEGLRNVWQAFKDSGAINVTVDAFKQLWAAGKALAPALASIGKSVGAATAALGVSSWTAFVAVLKAAGVVAEALAGPLQSVADFMEAHPALVVAAVAAWAGFKTIPGIVSKVTAVTDTLKSSLSGMTAKTAGAQATVKAITGDFRTLSPEIGRSGAAMKALGNNVPTIRNMQAAFVNAESGAKGFASSMRVGVVGAASSVGGAMKGLGGTIMGAFGGPVGLAIAGATALFLSQKSAAAANEAAHEKMTQAVYEGKKAQTELASALAGTTGELGDQGLAAAAKVAGGALAEFIEAGTHSNSIVEKVNQSTVAVDELINKIPGLGTEQSKANVEITKANAAAQDSYKQLEKSMDDLGIPMENLNSVIAQGGDEYGNLISKLRESGDAGNDAADQLEQARGKVQDLVNASRNMEPAMAQAAEGVAVLADASSSADDKLSALEKTMQALGLAPKDAQQAMMDAAAAVDEVAQSALEAADASGGLGDSLFNMDGQLEPTSANARELADTLNGMRGELQNVAVNGGDTQKTFEQMGPVLDSLQQKYGLTEEQMASLRQEYGLVPDTIETLVGLEGADEATQQLASIAAAVNSVPPGKDVNVGVLDEDAKTKLEQFGFKVETLKDGSSTINVQDQAALDKYNWWMTAGFPAIDMSNPTAKANLDNTGLLYNKDYAMMQLATLDLQRPMPWADMNISALSNAQLVALQKVGLLDGTNPTPDAYLNIDQLSTAQQQALAKVFNLDMQTPTAVADLLTGDLDTGAQQSSAKVDKLDKEKADPKVSLDPKPVIDGANRANQAIASITPRKDVDVVFTASYAGDWDRANRSGRATGGYWRGPSYASGGRHGGYQLPTTGPGTDMTDGFLAFDQNNIPAARLDAGEWIINARSSKKYGKELREINNGTYQKLPGYADGGIAHADDIDKFARGLEGKPYVFGGINWGDCSGAMSAIARYTVGMDPFGGRFTTYTERDALLSMGFKLGRGQQGDLRFGWMNGGPGGGHTAGTLPNGVNVEMGGAGGNGQYGGIAAGAWDAQFTDHAYLPVPTTWTSNLNPIDTSGFSVSGSGSTSSGSSSSSSSSSDTSPTSWSDVAGIAASSFAKGQVQDILGVLGIPDTPPALAAKKQWEEENARYQEQISASSATASESGQTSSTSTSRELDVPVVYDPSKGASQWSSTVEEALKRVGLAASNVKRTVEQIDIESGGDPNATNNWDSNAANGDPSKGLLQVIGSTFRAFRDKDLPNDQTHPLANIVAALNYVVDRYSGPESIWPTRAGYKRGGYTGDFGIDDVAGVVHGREFVVNAANTAKNLSLLQAMNSGLPAADLVSAASDVMSLMSSEGDVFAGLGKTSLSGLDASSPTSSSTNDRGSVSVTNNFTAANPDEMYRQYRRAAAKSHGGRIGAR
ncbi:tape measure protein [Corynebacterium variabile]|uniref:tape measure protein n=1 Tax=Corynebacterium variabile TaxID=1727 RepID=UPI00289DEBE2|nr:tape measure protein [Corynebacterium variabile]